MTYYRYNALDIAAYFKWTSMPSETERTYLDLVFQMREQILARPLSKDFETFVQAVYREMYHLWARGFENEFSDINLIAPEDSVALFCDQDFIALESYMKLLSMHLILAENLPYVRINFIGLPLLLGIEGDFIDYEKNVAKAAEMLHLTARDNRGYDFNLSLGISNEPLCLSLQNDFRKELFGPKGYRIKRTNDYEEKMRVLREKSTREQEEHDILHQAAEKRRIRRPVLPAVNLNQETPGAPVPPAGSERLIGAPALPFVQTEEAGESVPLQQTSAVPLKDDILLPPSQIDKKR